MRFWQNFNQKRIRYFVGSSLNIVYKIEKMISRDKSIKLYDYSTALITHAQKSLKSNQSHLYCNYDKVILAPHQNAVYQLDTIRYRLYIQNNLANELQNSFKQRKKAVPKTYKKTRFIFLKRKQSCYTKYSIFSFFL